MHKFLLVCLALGITCLSMSSPEPASAAGPLPYCNPYCCNYGVPDTQQCWHNGQQKTCGWFRVNYACP